jgi:transcriptional regulator with XRE-family HTH domain
MATKKGNGTRNVLKTYKSYLFIEKDPIIDAFRTARSDSGMSYAEVEAESGVKQNTLRNWEHGDVKSPFFKTMSAALIAVGVTRIDYGSTPRSKPKVHRK